jgi:hypothetical protein
MTSFTVRAAGLALVLVSLHAGAQDEASPRTGNGKPDFQGYWSMTTVTPFERPVSLGDKAFFTPKEFAAFEAERLEVEETVQGTQADVHYGFDDYGLHPSQNVRATNLRTSIIYEPANGRLPDMTPEAAAMRAEKQAWYAEHATDSAKNRMLQERCIVWPHNGPPMLPTGYNNNAKVIQTADHLVFMQEMMQDPRIIPLDGRDPVAASIGQWYGHSVGQWDGDTLVVTTTNFTGLTGRQIPTFSTDAVVTERFTLESPETILYQFTVEDPATFVSHWSGEFRMQKTTGPMFEYACHEGNYGIVDVLSAARAAEQETP